MVKVVYYKTDRVIKEGELVIKTKKPRDVVNKAYNSVDRIKFVLAGVVVTGDGRLCSMDVTKKRDLEKFLEGVGQILFIKPATGIIYRLPIKKAEGLRTSYEQAGMEMEKDELESFLYRNKMELHGGFLSSMSF